MFDGLKRNPRRAAKIAVFAVAIGFIGFAACVPAHRAGSFYDQTRGCPAGGKVENNQCVCPGGNHVEGWRCVPAQSPPQKPPQP